MRYLLNKTGAEMIDSPEFERISNDVIYLHLKRRVEQKLQLHSEEFPTFREWETLTRGIKSAFPGSDKSREAARLAPEFWRRCKLTTIYYMPRE